MTTTTATPVRFTQRPDHSLVLGLSGVPLFSWRLDL